MRLVEHDIIQEIHRLSNIDPLTYRLTVVKSGSYFMFGVTDTDRDYFVLNTDDVYNYLLCNGYMDNLDEDYDDNTFLSMRKDNVNIILVNEYSDLVNVDKATDVCTILQVTDKIRRIAIFDIIRGVV